MRYVLGITGLLWKLYVGVVFSVTALLMYPLITPLLMSERSKKLAFYLFVVWGTLFRLSSFYFLHVNGRRNIPNDPCVIIANHASYLDIFLIYSIFPRKPFVIMGKSELLRYPLLKTYFKRFNIPVFRGNRTKARKSVDQAIRALQNGWSVVVFPEGGIPSHTPPQMQRFKSGAFQIAKEAKAPILALTYVNNHRLFSDPSELLGRASPGISRIVIHEQLTRSQVHHSTLNELKDISFSRIKEGLESQ